MLKSKCLLDSTNLFSPNDYDKKKINNNNTKIFSITEKMKKKYCFICSKYRNLKTLKYHTS